MAAVKKNKKIPVKKPSRWWLIPKFLMLLGVGGLVAFIAVLIIMEQELNRIGFFSGGKRPALQAPKPAAPKGLTEPEPTIPLVPPPPTSVAPPTVDVSPAPVQPPAQVAGQAAREAAPAGANGEEISREDKKRLERATSSRSEELSHDDRKQLDHILRSR